jgi:hypothetical protein
MSLLQSHSWYNTSAVFLQVHCCCLVIVLDNPHSETVLQFASPTIVCVIVVLCSGKIARERRDTTALYQVLKIQLSMSNTSRIWDHYIESPYFSCNRLNITELIQIKGWISMAYSGISLSVYPYIFFLHGQWEFVCQQGVHETASAKHLLLSSHIYVRYKEMDIIFVTFLPP